MSPPTKILEAKCLCGSVHLNVEVPVSSLPLQAYMCHCSICRYSTGAPCIFHTRIPPEIRPTFVAPSSEANMTSWPVSAQSWKFCSTCGCHITAVSPEGKWTMSNSLFTDHSPELVQINSQGYSKSAKGGGISKMCSIIRGEEIEDINPPDDAPDAKIVESEQEFGPDGKERLRAECACGGVSFTVKRPDQAALDDKDLKQHVFSLDKSKWYASFDLCSDCRTANGTHVTGWMYLPRGYCEPSVGSDLKIGTMKMYESSPGTVRTFCGVCSATFFFTTSDRGPNDEKQIIDLATGVLRAPEGVMAEKWLGWRSTVSFAASGEKYDQGFAEALQKGMKDWVIGTYGQDVRESGV